MNKQIFYNFDKVNSYNALISFILGERGVGKTYGAAKAAIVDFIKSGRQFIYLRRYKSELNTSAPKFFDALIKNKEFENYKLSYKNQGGLTFFLVNDEVAGYAIALSTSNILKSTSFPYVRTIIFDEFCVTQGVYRYLTNEITQFLDLIETVGRLRDDLRVWMLGNSTSITNPYFSYWKLSTPYNSEFKTFKDGLIVVNYVKNDAYRTAKKASRFGRLIAGTKYGDYAIENKWLQDNTTFVRKRPANASFYFNFQMSGSTYGVWLDSEGYMYISNSYQPNSQLVFAFTEDDHNESTLLQSKVSDIVKNIVRHFRDARLIFETQQIKNIFEDNLLKFVN